MWGKFGPQLNKTQGLEFMDPVQFHRFLDIDKTDVHHAFVINEARDEIHFHYQQEDILMSPNPKSLSPVSLSPVSLKSLSPVRRGFVSMKPQNS